MKYEDFLNRKEIVDQPSGFEVDVKKLNKSLFDWQALLVKWSLKRGRAALFEDCGLGKGQPYGSKILTIDGWKNIESLTLSDRLISSDGKPYKLIEIYPKNEIDTYRIYYSDGNSQVFDIDHLHICRTNNDRQRGKDWRVLSTKDLLQLRLRYGAKNKSRNYDIPIVSPIQFQKKTFSITPYLLGVFLGDGHLKNSIFLSNPEDEIINRIRKELPDGVQLSYTGIGCDYRIVTGLNDNVKHPFRAQFQNIGLYNIVSNEKFIPKSYLFSDVDDRLNLLRGLMDTDGYIDDAGTSQFYTVSEKLKDDVKFLIQSLGGIPTESKSKGRYKNKEGMYIDCQDCYTLTFSLKTFNPFYLKRKANKWNINPRDNGRWIDRIEFESNQKTICLSVDSPDHSYITENCIVTHNTIQQLTWANAVSEKTKGSVLILAPLAVTEQTKEEGKKFNIPVNICMSNNDVKKGVNITNYEKLHKFNTDVFDGIVLDESGILKNFSGAMRNQIIDSFQKTPYRLACTATPAPNDWIELGNHAEFLGVMSRAEMLATFFINDTGDTGKWRLKGHVKDNLFWKWLSSWSVMLSSPEQLGFTEGNFKLPPITFHEHIIKSSVKPKNGFFNQVVSDLNSRRNIRKETIDIRCQESSELINSTDDMWVIWCGLNNESELLANSINDSVEVAGKHSDEQKAQRMLDFAKGKIKRIITKPSIAGHGMNWQVCNKAAFVGLNDSWEQFYQAVRRIWRFGQKKPVEVHIFLEEREGPVLKNIYRKEKQAKEMIESMIEHTKKLSKIEITQSKRHTIEYNPQKIMEIPEWLLLTKES